MQKSISMRKNISWNLTGSLMFALSQWLLLILISKLGTSELVGQYALGLAITAPITMFFSMKLRLILVTDIKSNLDFSMYLGTRLFTATIAILITTLLLFISNYDYNIALVIMFIAIQKAVEEISDIFYAQLQKNERMDYISKSRIIKGLLSVLVFGFILYLTGSLILAILAQTLMWILILLFYDIKKTKKYSNVKPVFQFPIIKSLTILGLPLGIMTLLNSLNTNIPRYIINYFQGAEELGYFAALAYIVYAGNTLVDSLRQPAATRLARYYSDSNFKEFNNLLLKLVITGIGIGIIGLLIAILWGETLLTYVYTVEYAQYNSLFIILMFSGVFSYITLFLDTGINAARFFKIQPYLALFWVLTTIIAGLYIIPKFGLLGAGYVILISSFIKFISFSFLLIYIIINCQLKSNAARNS